MSDLWLLLGVLLIAGVFSVVHCLLRLESAIREQTAIMREQHKDAMRQLEPPYDGEEAEDW